MERVGRWLRDHRRALLVHGSVLMAFLLFCLFVSPGLFEKLEGARNVSAMVDVALPEPTDDICFWVDSYTCGEQMIEVRGWAFVDIPGCEIGRTSIILQSSEGHCAFDTVVQMRREVTTFHGGPDRDLDWTGFLCRIPAEGVVNGQYALAILIQGVDEAFLQTTGIEVERTDAGFSSLKDDILYGRWVG